MVNVEQLKASVNRMSADVVREVVLELRLRPGDGSEDPIQQIALQYLLRGNRSLVPARRVSPATGCGGVSGAVLRVYDPALEAVEVLRWLKEFTEAAALRESMATCEA